MTSLKSPIIKHNFFGDISWIGFSIFLLIFISIIITIVFVNKYNDEVDGFDTCQSCS